MPEDDFLGDAPTHGLADEIVEEVFRVRVSLFGQAPGDTECHTARKDGDLVQRVGVGKHHGEDCVTALVDCSGALLFGAEHQALATGTHHDAVASIFEVDALDLLAAAPNGEECRFVDEVGQVGARHAGGCLRHDFQVDVGAHPLIAAMNLQDGQALVVLGQRYDDLSIEAAGTQ